MDKKSGEKLHLWQERLRKALAAYGDTLKGMSDREALYKGTREVDKGANSERVGHAKKASVVRNIVGEIIEAQVSSDIPQPKVTARHQRDEGKAKLIEDFLRNELDRLPFETLNDLDERTTPIHGADLFLVEWDSKRHTHTTSGELVVSAVHPRQVIPQPGVSEIADMDYIFVQMAQTKAYVKQKFGVDVSDEGEDRPEARTFDAGGRPDDLVTQNIAYYRGRTGGIGRFSWVNDIVLEDMDDYQARRLKRCNKCGQVVNNDVCQYCGSKAVSEGAEDYETLIEDIVRSDGSVIPAFTGGEPTARVDEYGNLVLREAEPEATRIPYYKPDIYPLVMRRNVSVFGQFLGESDVDKIRDQQNDIKTVGTKVQEKLLKGGSYVTLPKGKRVRRTDEELKVIEIDNPAEKAMVDVLTVQADISKDMAYLEYSYQAARNLIGITDSFQGRRDATATSGKAKEFAAAQSAGRLESKHTMKNAAYAQLFEIMFKFALAYADEPRPVARKTADGKTEYGEFSRYVFLEQDEAGEWYWNDEFLFSVDSAAPLASNREAMWQETRGNLKDGCFGNPADLKTLIRFWSKMELLHYPGATETRQQLEEDYQQQQMAQQTMMQVGGMQGAMPQMPDGFGGQADRTAGIGSGIDMPQPGMPQF